MRKKKTLALFMAAAMTMLTACGGGSGNTATTGTTADSADKGTETTAPVAAGQSVSRTKDVVAAVDVDFTTMDPMDTSDTLSGGVQRMMMDGLFGFDDDMKIYPMLATGYEANDNATEYTIKLREGISFTDGTPWNAESAKANFDKWADKTLGLKRTTLLCNILKTVETVDDYTLKITLTEPFGAFIATLAHPACVVMSPKQIEAGPAVCAEQPVGTGQYKFVERLSGEYLKLELNENWWGFDAEICGGTALADADAGFRTITFKPVAEAATRVAMLQSGDAQIIWTVPTESMDPLKNDSNVTVSAAEGIVVRSLMINNQKKPFSDKRVRQAMNYAINKDAYVAVVKNGLGSVATSILGPAVQYYKANTPAPYDVEKAKQLLTEAGYPNGFDCKVIYSNTTSNQKQAEFYKQQLEAVGINLILDGRESAIVNQVVQAAEGPGSDVEVELYISGWSTSTGDADWGLRPLLAKESEPPMSFNMCYFENDELEGYIRAGLESADDDVRREAYEKAQDLIWEEVPMILSANDFNTWATSSKVTGVKILADGSINMKNAKMVE